jgi:Immunity protein 49
MGLEQHALAGAMLAWFDQKDVHALKNWAYVSGKLTQWWFPLEKQYFGSMAVFVRLLMPLLSNDTPLIQWFATHDSDPIIDLRRAEDSRTIDFQAYQAIVALRGDWPRLVNRCKALLTTPTKSSNLKKFTIDNEFYRTLAKGDIAGMEAALREIASPKIVRQRSNDGSGFTQDLISSYAVIYAKIAWRHGYKVKVDSPYVPAEWLPNDPLDSYDNHYAFLK